MILQFRDYMVKYAIKYADNSRAPLSVSNVLALRELESVLSALDGGYAVHSFRWWLSAGRTGPSRWDVWGHAGAVRCGVCVCVRACVPCLCTNDAAKPRPHGNAAGYSVKLIREKQDISSATVFSFSELEWVPRMREGLLGTGTSGKRGTEEWNRRQTGRLRCHKCKRCWPRRGTGQWHDPC